MTIKEQEDQLILNLNLVIVLTVIIWLGVAGFISYKLWILRPPTMFAPTTVAGVPVVNQENLEGLRDSTKSLTVSNLPAVRLEPFD